MNTKIFFLILIILPQFSYALDLNKKIEECKDTVNGFTTIVNNTIMVGEAFGTTIILLKKFGDQMDKATKKKKVKK